LTVQLAYEETLRIRREEGLHIVRITYCPDARSRAASELGSSSFIGTARGGSGRIQDLGDIPMAIRERSKPGTAEPSLGELAELGLGGPGQAMLVESS
jgi:hypothetical protein